MKIAITSTGNSPDSKIDSRFGRCSYVVIYNSETEEVEYWPNPSKENIEGAGPGLAQFVASKGVQKIISGEFGGKVKSIFDSLKIQLVVFNDSQKSIGEIITMLNY